MAWQFNKTLRMCVIGLTIVGSSLAGIARPIRTYPTSTFNDQPENQLVVRWKQHGENEPIEKVIEYGWRVLAEGDGFSAYDMWAMAIATGASEYIVTPVDADWYLAAGELSRVGRDGGFLYETGDPVPPGVYWNMDATEDIVLLSKTDPDAVLRLPANSFLSIGYLVLESDDEDPAANGPGKIHAQGAFCKDGYSACCDPQANPPVFKCLSDTLPDSAWNDCEGGGKGASVCTFQPFKYVKCRAGYHACCNTTQGTYRCSPDNSPDTGCNGGGQGTEACGYQ